MAILAPENNRKVLTPDPFGVWVNRDGSPITALDARRISQRFKQTPSGVSLREFQAALAARNGTAVSIGGAAAGGAGRNTTPPRPVAIPRPVKPPVAKPPPPQIPRVPKLPPPPPLPKPPPPVGGAFGGGGMPSPAVVAPAAGGAGILLLIGLALLASFGKRK